MTPDSPDPIDVNPTAERLGRTLDAPPPTTALGALIGHVTGGHLDAGKGSFQPMNINYGLMPPMETPRTDASGKRLPTTERGRAKKRAMGQRALSDLAAWLGPDAALRGAA